MSSPVRGFSKRSKQEKIDWLIEHHFHNDPVAKAIIESYWNNDDALQQLHDDFIENTVSNFYLPLGGSSQFHHQW